MNEKALLQKYPELDPEVSGFAAYGRIVMVSAEDIGILHESRLTARTTDSKPVYGGSNPSSHAKFE